jgi:hypothetical protein
MTTQTIHHQLARARHTLTLAKDREKLTRAASEQQAIHDGRAGGKNAEERERSLTIALAGDAVYQDALQALRTAEEALAFSEADLEAFRDARRQEEWSIRAALVAALDRRSVMSDAPGSDDSFDDVADAAVYDGVTAYVDDADDDEAVRSAWSAHGSYNGHVSRRPDGGRIRPVDEDLPF